VVRAILGVSDLTPASDEALRMAARLAAASGAGLHLVHCAGLVGMPLREVLPLLEKCPPTLLAARLGEQIRRALPEGQADGALPHVEYRPAAEGALHTRRAVGAELVVVGMDAIEPPSLAAVVAAGAPVLVARDAAPPPFERVLVPLGAPDLAARTLRLACEWLRPFENDAVLPEMHVLHVSRRLADWRAIGDRFEAEVRAVETEVRRMGGVFHRHVRWSGAPWPAIVAASREMEADLVILRPDRGTRPADRDGRTWQAVVQQARTNVLLLPGSPAPSCPPQAVEALPARDDAQDGMDERIAAAAELEPVPA
jgi:nucleotide-binding universal stress UspA family protein